MNLVKLGEICDFYNGGAWKQSEFAETGYPVLKVSNCKNSGFEIDDVSFIPYEIAQKSENNKLYIGDVIIATVGSHPNLIESAAGRSCIVTKKVQGFYLNQNAVCLRSKNCDILDQRYLGYLAASAPFKHYIQSCGKGAANQMRIAIGAIKEYEFLLPEIQIQREIGTTLAAYDDLIENNQKQIKLLEEAAQRLYKEWFVDLRFPGHETTPIVDGIPEGWNNGILSDLAQFKRGKSITKKQASYGIVPVVAGGKEPAYYHNIANTAAPVITISASGYAGFVRLYYQEVWASDCSWLDASDTKNLYFIYCSLKHRQEDIYALQKGACQQHIYAKEVNALKFLIPCNTTLEQFQVFAAPLFLKISKLDRQIKLLAEARERLLPKLMNGEIEV